MRGGERVKKFQHDNKKEDVGGRKIIKNFVNNRKSV